MNYHSLFYFKKVAELQHLTKAAEELYVAQPSLSCDFSNTGDPTTFELNMDLMVDSDGNLMDLIFDDELESDEPENP